MAGVNGHNKSSTAMVVPAASDRGEHFLPGMIDEQCTSIGYADSSDTAVCLAGACSTIEIVQTSCQQSWTCFLLSGMLWPRWPSAADMRAGYVFAMPKPAAWRMRAQAPGAPLMQIEYGVLQRLRELRSSSALARLALLFPTDVVRAIGDMNSAGGDLRRVQVG
jgi:hypothetical protein